jgi:hypothetical protein
MSARAHELELKHAIDLLLQIEAQALSFEGSNPQHQYECNVFEDPKCLMTRGSFPA